MPIDSRQNRQTFMPVCADRGRCAGFTLIELAIVLAIVAVFAAISWPQLMRPWQVSQLKSEAHTIREWLIQTRQSSIEDSTVYQFRFKPGTNEYEIRSRDPVMSDKDATRRASKSDEWNDVQMDDRFEPQEARFDISDPDRQDDRFVDGDALIPQEFAHKFLVRGRLSPGMIFVHPGEHRQDRLWESNMPTESHQPALREDLFANQNENRDSEPDRQHHFHWSEPIDFFPSGRSVNAELQIDSEDGYSILVTVRGFTSTVIVGTPFNTPAESDEEDRIQEEFDAARDFPLSPQPDPNDPHMKGSSL